MWISTLEMLLPVSNAVSPQESERCVWSNSVSLTHASLTQCCTEEIIEQVHEALPESLSCALLWCVFVCVWRDENPSLVSGWQATVLWGPGLRYTEHTHTHTTTITLPDLYKVWREVWGEDRVLSRIWCTENRSHTVSFRQLVYALYAFPLVLQQVYYP